MCPNRDFAPALPLDTSSSSSSPASHRLLSSSNTSVSSFPPSGPGFSAPPSLIRRPASPHPSARSQEHWQSTRNILPGAFTLHSSAPLSALAGPSGWHLPPDIPHPVGSPQSQLRIALPTPSIAPDTVATSSTGPSPERGGGAHASVYHRDTRSRSPLRRAFTPEEVPSGRIVFRWPSPRKAKAKMACQPTFESLLSHKVEVVFETREIDMVGSSHTGTSYSLAGHVKIDIAALPDNHPWGQRILKALKLDVEGSAEYSESSTGRYNSMRTYRQRVNVVSAAMPIPNVTSVIRRGSRRLQFAVPFDVHIPGWLPPTLHGTSARVLYGAVASTEIAWTQLVTPAGQISDRRSSAWTEFGVRRHRLPSAMGLTPERADRHYTLSPERDENSPVECVVTLPDWVDLDAPEKSIKVSMRIRSARRLTIEPREEAWPGGPVHQSSICTTRGQCTRGADPIRLPSGAVEWVHPEGTRMLELGMEVEEIERSSSIPSQSYTQSYPVPFEQPSRQTPQHALLGPAMSMPETPLGETPATAVRANKSRSCLLADDGTQRNFMFSGGGLVLGDKWRKVNIALPMPSDTVRQRANKPLAGQEGPFFRVKHNLKIKIVCKEPSNPTGASTVVVLSAPIKFGTRPAEPIGQSLVPPPYIGVFYENGETRDCDPLPAYEEATDIRLQGLEQDDDSELSGSDETMQASPPPEPSSLPTLPSIASSVPSTALPTGLVSSASMSSFFETEPGSNAMSRSPTSRSLADEQRLVGHGQQGPGETLSDILRGLDFATQPDQSGDLWDMSPVPPAQAAPAHMLPGVHDGGVAEGEDVYEDDEADVRPAVRRRTDNAAPHEAPMAAASRMTRAWRRAQQTGSAAPPSSPPPPPSIVKHPSGGPDAEEPSSAETGLQSTAPG